MENELIQLNKRVAELKQLVKDQEKTINELKLDTSLTQAQDTHITQGAPNNVEHISNKEINRYSRQIILPNFGVQGQLALRNAAVLIVGAGGLGCPCTLYLVGAGIGHIGILDYDQVELNNLHRQILHKENCIGDDKVASATSALKGLNSDVIITPFHTELNSSNAIDLVSKFDIVVDASDNVATRYLLNDACFLCQKPLVSGSALQMEGQLTVYHHGDGPCYRCLFPVPPPPTAVTNCGEGGVLGVIPGTIGVLQALQVINVVLKRSTLAGALLLFDGDDCTFRRLRLRGRSPKCALCGEAPTITALIDYEAFCSAKANDKNPNLKLLSRENRISPLDFAEARKSLHLLIDVRSAQEFSICRIPDSVNVPIRTLESGNRTWLAEVSSHNPLFVVCRRGNDSQKAVLALTELLPGHTVKDIVGGLHAWARDVDSDFPVY